MSVESNLQESILNLIQQFQDETHLTDGPRNNLKEIDEFYIQINRILQILDSSVKKIEISFCLPMMILNKEIMWKTLTVDERSKVYTVCKKYFSENKKIDEIEFDGELSDVLHICFGSDLLEELPKYVGCISSSGKRFISNMKELRRIVKFKLNLIAPKEMGKEKVLHKIWQKNEKIKDKSEKIKNRLEKEENILQEILKKKIFIIDESEKKLSLIKSINQKAITEELDESNKIMTHIFKESDEVQGKLSTDAEKTEEEYQKLLNTNLINEKMIREQKSKIQQNLKNWVNKYDLEIGERSKRLSDSKDLLKQKEKEFNNWKLEFEQQEREFHRLMNEKAAEEKRIQEEKLLLFMMNRAAITIQRAWRRVLAKKKKKKSKGKKGKK